jgi:Flp pilus assembly protein TadG
MVSRIWLRIRRSARDLPGDTRGIAAIEFAMIVPLMLVLFFGTVEFSSGVAVDRKVTLMARTLSDLTSQQDTKIIDSTFTNIFNASTGIMTPVTNVINPKWRGDDDRDRQNSAT